MSWPVVYADVPPEMVPLGIRRIADHLQRKYGWTVAKTVGWGGGHCHHGQVEVYVYVSPASLSHTRVQHGWRHGHCRCDEQQERATA